MNMTRTANIFAAFFLIVFGASLLAQQQSNGKTGKPEHLLVPTVYLGKSDYKGGPIKKDDFARLLRQGLTSHDSLGYKYKVVRFDFNYAERQLYEDSVGNLKVMTDFMFEFCPGDTVTSAISASIYDRVKPGDTVFIDRVMVARYTSKSNKNVLDTNIIAAKSMKCVIIK